VFAEEKLGCLLVLLKFDVVDAMVHFVFLDCHLLAGVGDALAGPDRVDVVGVHQIFFVHEEVEQSFLEIVVFGPCLFFDDVLDVRFYFGDLGDWIDQIMLEVVDDVFLELEALDAGVGQLRHDIPFDLGNFIDLHPFELNLPMRTSVSRLRYSSCVQLLFLKICHFLAR
jgi:hypothetical protein